VPNYAEVIFEPGSKSIVSYDDQAELEGFLAEHHRRAMNGEPGAPQDQEVRGDIDYSDPGMVHPDRARLRPAERITKVFLYGETHPADLHPTGVAVNSIQSLVTGMADENGVVDEQQLIRALRDEVSPVYPQDQGRHESLYKADAQGELDLSFLENTGTNEDGEPSA
jgi:hypothetical protein